MPILFCQVLVFEVNTAKFQDEQFFLDLLVAQFRSIKKFSITFTKFPPSLIGVFSVVTYEPIELEKYMVEIVLL